MVAAPGGLHRVPPGGAQEGGHRARRLLALLVHLPGRHPGARLRVAHPERRVREGVPARPRRHAAGRHARPRLLRAVRSRLHARLARGAAADPPPQALHRRRPLRAVRRTRRRDPRAERPPGGHRRVRAGRPDRRLAARPQGLRGQDLRGRAEGRRLPAPGHPGLPPAVRGRRAGHRQRHRARRRDRHERPGQGPRRAPRRGLRRRAAGHRHAAARRSSACPATSSTASSAASTSCARSSSARAST